jgi:adenylate cyclase
VTTNSHSPIRSTHTFPRWLLEGSVRPAGHRVPIVAQLIDAKADQHLWAETYNRRLTGIFAIQTDVAL